MLTDLKSFLADRHAASLSEMARRFSMEPDALRPMLDHWIRKGKVRRSGGSRCQGCIGCAAADVEIYEWVRPVPDARMHPADTTGRHHNGGDARSQDGQDACTQDGRNAWGSDLTRASQTSDRPIP